jgi:hypothetical protein
MDVVFSYFLDFLDDISDQTRYVDGALGMIYPQHFCRPGLSRVVAQQCLRVLIVQGKSSNWICGCL